MATTIQEPATRTAAPNRSRVRRGVWRHELVRWFLILLFVWALSGLYEGVHLKRGFVSWDAGAYAESAVRVLHGQLPHRDFIEVYTGGLTYLNAAAMRVFGVNLVSERLMLFAFFLAWIPALYWIASQFCRDWIAGGLVLLAVAWSVPNYSEAVPSWYNLFFATFGVATLLAHLKRPSWRWLQLAGLCGGFSFLAKSVGLCYVAGVLLFFVFREQSIADQSDEMQAGPREAHSGSRTPLYTAFVLVCLALFFALLLHLISPLIGAAAGEFVLFVLPSMALCGVLLANELRICGSRTSFARFAHLLRMCIPFGSGVIVPFFLFLAPFLRAHGTGSLLHDLFAQASSRIALAHDLPDEIITIAPAIFLATALAFSMHLGKMSRWVLIACIAGLFTAGLILALFDYNGYIAVWSVAYWTIPILVVIVAFLLVRRGQKSWDSAASQRVFLLLSVAVLCSLVEFPFSSPIYFCYVAPLAILSLAAALQPFACKSRVLLSVIYVALLIFVVFEVTPGFIYAMGYRYEPDIQQATMQLPRAGSLRVDPQTAAVYEELIPLIRAHAAGGEIYAAPDCPEVYFLSGYRNLTGDIYDFLDAQSQRSDRTLQIITDPRVRVVVLNNKPSLSPPVPGDLHSQIVSRFPEAKRVGAFEVRWRD